jgi:hypothetical protein
MLTLPERQMGIQDKDEIGGLREILVLSGKVVERLREK